MKSTVVVFSFLLLLTPLALKAQSSNNSRIDRLRGGILGLKIKWSGEIFSTSGTRADAMGGSISTLYPGAEAISWNPAGLGFAHGFHLTLDWAPAFTIDPGGLLGIQNGINDALTRAAENNSPSGVVAPGTVEDAVVNSALDMRGGLKGGAFLYGNPVFAVAAAFHEPFRLESQLTMSGTEFNAVALNDDGDVTHRIFGTVNGNFNLEITFLSSSVAFGTRITPDLSFGMAYDNFNVDQTFEGTTLPEGIISASGTETFFNDPRKIQYDSLYARIKGNWEGSGFRFRWGLGYHVNPDLSLDAVFVMPMSISVSGPFSMVHNNIRALNLGAGEDQEVFDIDVLVEDNLTKTEKRITKVPGMEFELPGSLSLGFSTRWQNYLASLVYVKHFDHAGYKLAYEQFDSLNVKIKGGNVHQGVNLGSTFRLGIGVEQLILGLGVVFGETFDKEVVDSKTEPKIGATKKFLIPLFSLGGGFKISSRFRLDYIVSPYYSSFLRFSTSYRL